MCVEELQRVKVLPEQFDLDEEGDVEGCTTTHGLAAYRERDALLYRTLSGLDCSAIPSQKGFQIS